MKASNLMVYDWVRHINGTPMQVERIDKKAFACGIPHCWDYNNKYEPIPITQEILEKNGFKHRIIDCAEYYYIADDYYDITISEWSDSIWLVRYDCTEMSTPHEQMTCSYVHQLQNFLRLLGLSELADNFKV